MAWLLLNEIYRKTIHLLILLVLLVFTALEERYSKQAGLFFITGLLGILLILEYMRLELGWKIPFFSHFIRPKEEHRINGGVYFLASAIITLGVFDFRIALAALLMTTFGDLAASFAGKTIGSSLIYRSKTWAGFIAETAVNLIVGFIVLNNIYVIIGMAIVASVAEILVEDLDDNLIIPVFSGFAGQLIKFML